MLTDEAFTSAHHTQRTQVAGDISKWLVSYRDQHKLTQTQLGQQIGCTQPVIARMELGEYEPRLSTLRNLSKILGVSFLLRITPEETKTKILPKRK